MKKYFCYCICVFFMVLFGCESAKIRLAEPEFTNLDLGTSGTSGTPDSVTIYWNGVANASGYEVYQASSPNGEYSKVKVSTITIISFTKPNNTNYYKGTITGLNANTIYYFKIIALGSGNYSDSKLSDYISATTSKIKLATPNDLIVVTITSNSITISWNSIDNASDYEVYQSDPYKYMIPQKITDNINITETTATITGLPPNTSYRYYVLAVGSGSYSNSELSGYIGVRTKNKLATPDLTLGGTITSDSVTILWKYVFNASNYEVYQSNSPNGTYSNVSTTKNNSVTITGLTAYTTYYFKVMAIGNEDYSNSELSDYISATPKIQLATPTGLTIVTVIDTTVSISWNGVTNASSYEVYKSYNIPDGEYYSKVSTTTNSGVTITGLGARNKYYFKVMAVGNENYSNSELSDYISANTGGVKPKASPPTGLRYTSSSSIVTILWNAVTNVNSYGLYVSRYSSGTYTAYQSYSSIGGVNLSLYPNSSSETYYFKVKCNNSEYYSESELSNYISITNKFGSSLIW